MAINISQIIAEYGAYYKPGNANVKNILLGIRQQSETDKFFRPIRTSATRLEHALAVITSVLQGYQDTFTPAGNTTFTPRPIDLDQLKIDYKENPSKLENSWLGFLTSDATADRSKWPFVKWLVENLIIPQSIEDWELKGVFGGVKGAVTPGTVNPIETAVNGIKKQFNVAIGAGDLTPITLGVVPTDDVDFVDYIEAFVDNIPQKYQKYLQEIVMSHTLLKRYKRGMEKKYNMNYDKANITDVMHTQLSVAGVASHEGSGKIWTTLKGNAIMAIKKPDLQTVFELEKVDREIKLYTDFWKTCTFVNWEWVFTNDVELS